ncbi:MAG TPA: thiol peroxidase [Anaerolineae bacterium]|nr:thiol peroxidase [Anaerolineae bacterium]HMR67337.1 thiol peroxidase [Anaerolineae bacterium]
MSERLGDVTFKGTPLTVLGPRLEVGDQAPDFALANNLFSPQTVTLGDSAGKVRLFNVVPSLATGICDAQTKRFNEEIAQYGDKVVGYTVSVDLPIAQANWCTASGVDKMQMLSDYRTMSFGDAYGTHIKEIRIEQRAVFVVDADGTIRYVEYVPEIAQHPDYNTALAALKEVAG